MKIKIISFIVAMIFLYLALFSGMYNGINKGVYIDIGNISYGYEYKGDIGFFKCTLYDSDFSC